MIWSFIFLFIGLSSTYARVDPKYLIHLSETGQDEEFARLLGIPGMKINRPSSDDLKIRTEEVDIFSKPVSPLGDIMLTEEQWEQSRQGIKFCTHPSYKWQNREMPYVIMKHQFSPEQINVIEEGIEIFNRNISNVKLIQAGKHLSYERVIYIINAQGCWSYVGSQRQYQPVSLDSNGCVRIPTILHEMMHAAGFTHEQNRADRDDYITVNWGNISEEWHPQFRKVNGRDFENDFPYDHYSVMHYPVNAGHIYKEGFSVHRKDINQALIGHGHGFTELDVKKMNALYKDP